MSESFDRKTHWEQVYRTKSPTAVSWYQPEPTPTLDWFERLKVTPNSRIVDAGGGASLLVDALAARGFASIRVIDISAAALDVARARLADAPAGIAFIEGDVTTPLVEPGSVDLWHDRAVFHFLTDPADRRRYVANIADAVRPGGFALIATFAEDGPLRCSDLDIVRYDENALAAEFESDFDVVATTRQVHVTPAGREQKFVWVALQRRAVP